MDEKENGVEEVQTIMLINIDNCCISGAHIYLQDGNLISLLISLFTSSFINIE